MRPDKLRVVPMDGCVMISFREDMMASIPFSEIDRLVDELEEIRSGVIQWLDIEDAITALKKKRRGIFSEVEKEL